MHGQIPVLINLINQPCLDITKISHITLQMAFKFDDNKSKQLHQELIIILSNHDIIITQAVLLIWLHTIIITSLVAIYFSETGNICQIRVLNCEIWHRHR